MNYVCFGYHLVNKQWGSCYIQEGNNKVEITMPISWGKWGLMCFTGLMTQGLFTPIKWMTKQLIKIQVKQYLELKTMYL